MIELIAQIILIVSLGGLVFLASHKIPALIKLAGDEVPHSTSRRKEILSKIKNSAIGVKQKIATLKAIKKQDFKEGENKKKSQVDSDGDYWQKIKRE